VVERKRCNSISEIMSRRKPAQALKPLNGKPANETLVLPHLIGSPVDVI